MATVSFHNVDRLLVPSELTGYLRRSGFNMEQPIGVVVASKRADFYQPPLEGQGLLTDLFWPTQSRLEALEKRFAALEAMVNAKGPTE